MADQRWYMPGYMHTHTNTHTQMSTNSFVLTQAAQREIEKETLNFSPTKLSFEKVKSGRLPSCFNSLSLCPFPPPTQSDFATTSGSQSSCWCQTLKLFPSLLLWAVISVWDRRDPPPPHSPPVFITTSAHGSFHRAHQKSCSTSHLSRSSVIALHSFTTISV